jgi:hypothetical protein
MAYLERLAGPTRNISSGAAILPDQDPELLGKLAVLGRKLRGLSR